MYLALNAFLYGDVDVAVINTVAVSTSFPVESTTLKDTLVVVGIASHEYPNSLHLVSL